MTTVLVAPHRGFVLLCCLVLVVGGSSNGSGGGFFKRFSRAPPPPPDTHKAWRKARDDGLEAIEKRRAELEREVVRLTNEIDGAVRRKGKEYSKAALKTVEAKRREVQRELRRVGKEIDTLTRERAAVAEKAAQRKLSDLEQFAKEEANRLASVVEVILKQKAASAEEAAKRKLTELEETAIQNVLTFLDNIGRVQPAAPRMILSKSVAEKLLSVFRTVVLISALGNILGLPKQVVDLWENQGFGDEFIPFDVPVDKRVLAGCLEFCGFFLLSRVGDRPQMAGCILILFMFGRGAWFHSKRGWLVLFPATVAVLAATLIANKYVALPETNTSKKRR